MGAPRAAVTHYREGQALRAGLANHVRKLWTRMDEDFDRSWQLLSADVNTAFVAAKTHAAVSAVEYTVAVEADLDMDTTMAGKVNVAAFAGTTRSGLPVESVTRTAIVEAKAAVAAGMTPGEALTVGGQVLQRLAVNEVTQARSDAVAAAITATPTTTGYVRMLNPPSCRACIVLAGKWFRWNQGFDRHPRCDCVHVPAREAMSELRTDPYVYFHSLTRAEQERIFGVDDAQAIRDGADIYRVVNIRDRGASKRKTWSGRLYDTPMVTMDQILAEAGGNRGKAIALMREHGFILEQGQIAGGVFAGNDGGSPWGYSAGALGRGGARKGATEAYRRAVETGERDILNPATQTAAERRFHTAYLNKQAADAGRNPYSRTEPLTARYRAIAERAWQRQLETLQDERTPQQIHDLAAKLGVK